MNKLTAILILMAIVSACKPKTDSNSALTYPETKKVDTVDVYFGVSVPDPYRWLENDTSAETAAWVKAQNEVTFSYLNAIPFREKIKNRLTEIWNFEKYTTPFFKGGRYFFFKNDGLQNQYVMYVMDSLNAEPKVLLDPNKLSTDGTKSLSGTAISKDGKYMIYSVSTGGSDWSELFVLNIETGETLTDNIEWVKFSDLAWYKNGFFYSSYDKPTAGAELSNINEYHKVFYHQLGTSQADDKLFYENKNFPQRLYNMSVSENEEYFFLYEMEASEGNMVSFKKAGFTGNFTLIADNMDFSHGIIDVIDNKFIMQTNEKAPKYRLVEVNPTACTAENWKDILPEKENVLESVEITTDKFFATYMQDAHSKLEVYNLKGEYLQDVVLPTLGTVSEFSASKENPDIFYSFTSYTYPSVVFKYNVEENVSTVYREPKINFDFSQYETKQVFYTSKDGTKIPMFIVHKKGLELNGNNPTLLYGYGGFNVSLTPSFSTSLLIWLENGGVFAVANLRGGGEYGKEWHEAGQQLNKQNVFDDFIAAAEFLIAEKYTSSSKLAIQGGSNGGLLIGAVTNQRPELFRVALPQVGVMDMLRFHKFTIGWAWTGDYGSSDDEVQFKNLFAISPLHNIKENVEYPAVLVTTADHDDRVVPAHSFKYIATLQEKYKGANPVMIRIDTMAGHGAGKPTDKIIEEHADTYSFIFKNMGITPYNQ